MSEGIEYLSHNELKALLGAVSDLRDRAVIILFLNTGIFLNELVDLKTNSVKWEKKLLAVPGSRKREISLNDQVYQVLAKWSQERPDSRTNYLFTTTKGKVKGISPRMIDHLIRKYAAQAGIKRRVNAQVLRNTFAVRLFSEEVSVDKAAAIMGITDSESISRYIKAARLPASRGEPARQAKQPPLGVESSPPPSTEHLDSRHKVIRAVSKMFPVKPREAKQILNLKGPIAVNPEEVIFGRAGTIADIKTIINHNHSVLLVGQLGVGKTHLLRHFQKLLGPQAFYFASPSPVKAMLTRICDKLNPDWGKQVKSRASVKDILNYIIANRTSDLEHKILILDNLQNLRASDLEILMPLLEHFTILGATRDTNPKLKSFWWKFKQIELKPLSNEAAKELIRYLTQNLSVKDYDLLENRLLNLSDRLPLPIVDMVHQVAHKELVSVNDVRSVYHEAGIKYRDWTPILLILWGVIMISRFVALGSHSFEGYILAGTGMAVIMTITKFLRMKR